MEHLEKLMIYVFWLTIALMIFTLRFVDFANTPDNVHFKLMYPHAIIVSILARITYKKYKTFSDKK